jgi:arsenite methyltransferase
VTVTTPTMRALTEDERAEIERDAHLPQTNAVELVDADYLVNAIKDMYREVAENPDGDFHFLTGRSLAEQLGYPTDLLDAVPAAASASFAGVGYYFDYAALRVGETVVDLGSGSGNDLFAAAVQVGETGRVIGIDMTDAQLAKSGSLRDQHGFAQVELIESRIEDLPLEDASVDCVISNGVINLAPDKDRVFREAARVLKPGGRFAIADIVSGRPLVGRTRRNSDLWAACIGGAVPRESYLGAIEGAGLAVQDVRDNPYEFITEHALQASAKYGVVSISLLATK